LFSLSDPAESGVVASDFIRAAGAALGRALAAAMERGDIRRLDPEQAAFEFIAPLVLICLENITLASGPIDAARVRRRARAHIEFFAAAVRPD
jgi:hypothetical protein